MPQFVASLTDDARVIIYDCNMSKIQAAGRNIRTYNTWLSITAIKKLWDKNEGIFTDFSWNYRAKKFNQCIPKVKCDIKAANW